MEYKIILLYDIPCKTKEEKQRSVKYNKFIKKIGFIYIQNSVYVMTVYSKEKFKTLQRDLKLASPKDSNIRLIKLTKEQFSQIQLLSGDITEREKILSNKYRILNY